MPEHNPQDAYELGLSAGLYGEGYAELVHDCQECNTAYQRGIDDGLNKLLGTVKP